MLNVVAKWLLFLQCLGALGRARALSIYLLSTTNNHHLPQSSPAMSGELRDFWGARPDR